MKMKRVCAMICAGVLVCFGTAVLPAAYAVYAEEDALVFQGLRYEISDNAVTITDYTDDLPTELVIPAEIDGMPVISIGDGAFYECPGITSVTIPEGVTCIKYFAFCGCTGLTKIIIPKGVTSIEDGAFCRCTNLNAVTIPDSVTSIGYCAFAGTPWQAAKQADNPLVIVNGMLIDGIKAQGEVIIPDGVRSIENAAFLGSKTLTAITIPASVTSIGESSFVQCENLTIKGYTGSYAETYAKEHEIPFESLGESAALSTGDLSGDGGIEASDAQMTLQAYVNMLAGKDSGLTDAQTKAADVDGDGEITALDAQMILQYYVNTLAGKTVTWEELMPKQKTG